jgi:hypothetical protein
LKNPGVIVSELVLSGVEGVKQSVLTCLSSEVYLLRKMDGFAAGLDFGNLKAKNNVK